MKYTLLINNKTGERSIWISKFRQVGERVFEKDNPVEYARLRKLAVNNHKRADRDDAMRSLGLVKVTGALGGKYWE